MQFIINIPVNLILHALNPHLPSPTPAFIGPGKTSLNTFVFPTKFLNYTLQLSTDSHVILSIFHWRSWKAFSVTLSYFPYCLHVTHIPHCVQVSNLAQLPTLVCSCITVVRPWPLLATQPGYFPVYNIWCRKMFTSWTESIKDGCHHRYWELCVQRSAQGTEAAMYLQGNVQEVNSITFFM